jgi:hypothetical protein
LQGKQVLGRARAKTFGGSPLPADFWWPPRPIAAALVLAQSNIVPPKAESNPRQWISAFLTLTTGLRRVARQGKIFDLRASEKQTLQI